MPRLESITVSHSILSLTCDRNKAVLNAACSAAGMGTGMGTGSSCQPLPGTTALLPPNTSSSHSRPFPGILQPFSLPAGRWVCATSIALSIRSV